MSGSGKDVLGMVGISQDGVGAGTFPDTEASHLRQKWPVLEGNMGEGVEVIAFLRALKASSSGSCHSHCFAF